MFEKPCRCGSTKKNFRIDIGPFFIAECCKKAGYDNLGNRLEPSHIGLTKEDVEEALKVKDLEVDDEGEQSEESKADKKKRRYNRGGNIKKES